MEGVTQGRIVHYTYGVESFRKCRAAIITEVWTPEVVNLWVFDDGQQAGPYGVVTSISYVNEDTPVDNPSWHWPERG